MCRWYERWVSKMYEAVESLVRERIAGQTGKVGGNWYVGAVGADIGHQTSWEVTVYQTTWAASHEMKAVPVVDGVVWRCR